MAYSNVETVTKYNKALASLTTGDDRRKETVISYSDRSNWQNFLQPAPITIALLGQIMLVSSKMDFSLMTQNANFNKLKYPESFRASMVQLSNDGWQAFNMANGNMDEISLESDAIPRYVKEAIECLFRGSPRDIQISLPRILRKIVQSADACTKLAEQTQQKFYDVMLLAQELLEASVATRSTNERELRSVQRERKVLEELIETAKAQKVREEKMFDMLSDSLKSCDKDFKAAANAMPSGWGLIGLTMAEGFANATIASLNAVTSAMTSAVTSPINFVKGGAGVTKEILNLSRELRDIVQENDIEISVCSLSEKVLPFVYALNELLEVKADDKVGVDGGITGENGAEYLKNMFRHLRPTIDTDETKNRSNIKKKKKNVQSGVYEAADICDAGQAISEKVVKAIDGLTPDQQTLHLLARDAKILLQRAEAFSTKEKIIENMPATTAPIPRTTQLPLSSDSNIARMSIKNAQFKLEQTKAVLTQKQASFDKTNDNLRQTTESLAIMVGKMSNLDLDKIEIEEVRQILLNAIRMISEFQSQWGLLVGFFRNISNIIKVQLTSDAVNNFVAYTDEGTNTILGGVTLSDFARTNIYNYAMQAGQISHFVNMISKTYVQVSEKFIMPQLSSLGQLVAVDDPQKISALQRRLHNDCEAAKLDIDLLLKQRTREFDNTCQERLAILEATISGILPPPDTETEQLNKSAIEEGVRKALEEQSYNAMSDEDIENLY